MPEKNDLLLRVMAGKVVERPPVWLMRQAGRILPQYKAVRNSLRDFKELVESPHLASEVTIQPVDELQVDAAIIFSDILVIPDAMGLSYEMEEKKGPVFPETIDSSKDIDNLSAGNEAAERLSYVYEAINITQQRLNGRVPLIGFCGAPWTLMAYMVEGGGSKTFSKAKAMLYKEPVLAHRLLDKITDTLCAFVELQIKSGAQVIQIFDSWAGMLDQVQYKTFAIPYLDRIIKAINSSVPVTIFSKGAWFSLADIAHLNCTSIGLDWHTSPLFARNLVGHEVILQGNLDPCQLYSNQEDIHTETNKMIRNFNRNHIVNLGHGVYPDTPLENVRTFVKTVKEFKYT
jgi:uroporphyrinogen decarboxylase